MKTILFTIYTMLVLTMPVMQTDIYKIHLYEIESSIVGVEGTYLIDVYVNIDKEEIDSSDDILRQSAIHGVIFKGFKGREGCSGQPPLANDPECEVKHKQFFNTFFRDSEKHEYFAEILEGSFNSIKLDKHHYQIGATIVINKNELRNYLEKNNVISSLTNVF